MSLTLGLIIGLILGWFFPTPHFIETRRADIAAKLATVPGLGWFFKPKS